MKITLDDRKCPLAGHEQTVVLRRLRLSLGRFDDVISRLIVVLSPADKSRGRAGKDCRLVAGTRFGPPIELTEWGVDTLEAVTQAAARMARAVGRATDFQSEPGWQGSPTKSEASL